MSVIKIKEEIGGIDIYLLDQILKERYLANQLILDAGCGSGRNLKWFYNNSYKIFGIDSNIEKIDAAKKKYYSQKEHFSVGLVEKLKFEDDSFHHIICNAVLHFAKDENHFKSMFSELIRVLKPNGTLFIRMTSDIGIKKHIKHIANGVYKLPDGTERFLLTNELLQNIMNTHQLTFLESLKTVNVDDKRCMTTLMLQYKV